MHCGKFHISNISLLAAKSSLHTLNPVNLLLYKLTNSLLLDTETACNPAIHKDVDLVKDVPGFNAQDFEIRWFHHEIWSDLGPNYEYDIYSMSGESIEAGEPIPFEFDTVWKKYKLNCDENDIGKKGLIRKVVSCQCF